MSIPTLFNPLGTTSDQYITDGLIFWLDAGYEPKGTKDYITELTTGTRYYFDNGGLTTFNGKEAVIGERLSATTVGFPDWVPESTENSVEVVACCSAESSHLCVCPWIRQYSSQFSAYYPNIRMGWEPYWKGDTLYCTLHVIDTYADHERWIIDPIRTVNCYYEYETPPYLNGMQITTKSGTNGSVCAGLLYIKPNAIFGAFRLYNRKLTPEERIHNLVLDMKRFDLETVRG